MKLSNLVSEHPGGWSDVISVIKEKWPDVTVDLRQNLWGVTTKRVDKYGIVRDVGIGQLEISDRINNKVVLSSYLEALDQPITGLLMADACRALMQTGFPVPGDPQWKKRASFWRRDA